MLDMKNNVMTFSDIYLCILIGKTHEKSSMSRVNISLMIWNKDDIQEEISFFAFTPFTIHLRTKCVFNKCQFSHIQL